MNDTAPPTTDPLSDMFQQWKLWKDRTQFAQAKERELRAAIITQFFPAPTEGTNKNEATLADGRVAKLTLKYPIERKVDEVELRTLFKAAREVEGHLLGAVNFDKLIRNKPELATKEYRDLTDEQRTLFDTCLLIKPGSAQLELNLMEI